MSKKCDEEELLAVKHHEESIIMELKVKKSRGKAAFTRSINKFKEELDNDKSEKEAKKSCLTKVEQAMEMATHCIHELCEYYRKTGRTDEMVISMKELEVIDQRYEEIVQLYHSECGVSFVEEISKKVEKKQLGSDLWKQLRRVSIPVVEGNKAKYPAWKAAFYSCIDEAPATPEYKLLQLRLYLGGNALHAIDNLGHSAEAHEAAKDRLERKFGGVTRIVNRFLDELENFQPIRNENVKELEKFADLLDIAVINLKEVKHEEDLKNGSLYHRLLKILPHSMLTRYNRQVTEKDLTESVETLRIWVNAETEYAIRASETINGLSIENRPNKSKSFSTNNEHEQKCTFCGNGHKVWFCESFKTLNIEERWKRAKDLKLCYRCLQLNHVGNKCRFKGKCGINGCDRTHNRLLHKDRSELNAAAAEFQPEKVFSTNNSCFIALRTIPVIIKTKNREIKVNALLDDGSTKTYLNEDIAWELGLTGEKRLVEVNVIKENLKSLKQL